MADYFQRAATQQKHVSALIAIIRKLTESRKVAIGIGSAQWKIDPLPFRPFSASRFDPIAYSKGSVYIILKYDTSAYISIENTVDW
jgi:hypothetical protein